MPVILIPRSGYSNPDLPWLSNSVCAENNMLVFQLDFERANTRDVSVKH